VDSVLVAVVLMWASTFVLFKVAWRNVDPVAFTAVRFAAIVLLAGAVLALSRNRVPLRRADVPLIVASGLCGYFLYQLFFVLGLDRTSAVASAILVATHPLFSVLFLWMLWRERPTRIQLVGVALGFVGVAVFLGFWDAFGAATWGDLLSLAAAAAFGAYGVLNRPLTRRYPGAQLMASTLAVGGVLVALVGIPAVVRQDWGDVSASSWLIMVYAVIGPVYLAYALWNWAIKHRGVTRTVVYGFLTPVAAGVLAVLALDERLTATNVVGAIIVLAALVIVRVPSRSGRAELAAPPAE
jgi:drug/metabolite transporter (DMT)-like permease